MLPADAPYVILVTPTALRWSAQPTDGMVAVEEGVNAATCAASAMLTAQRGGGGRSTWQLPGDLPGPPPAQLTAAEVQQQIEVMASAMLGRGASRYDIRTCVFAYRMTRVRRGSPVLWQGPRIKRGRWRAWQARARAPAEQCCWPRVRVLPASSTH